MIPNGALHEVKIADAAGLSFFTITQASPVPGPIVGAGLHRPVMALG
jgi:hypothetical protein